MCNNIYQEYINNIFGRNPDYNRMESSNFENTIKTNNFFQNSINNVNLEKLYPDIYRLIYPMIQHACIKNTNQLTESTIDDMVEEIYSNFVSDNNNDNGSSRNEVRSARSSEVVPIAKLKNSSVTTAKKTEAVTEKRQIKQENVILRDLIRILVLRELLGIPGGNRPGWQQLLFRPSFRHSDFVSNNLVYETSPIIY